MDSQDREEDGLDWNEYALGFDARLRNDAFDHTRSTDWKLGWKDCDAQAHTDQD